ncbi:hypothetical protein [Paraburkholderia antibiotica]|uniref:Uncharacterized protein n=1 Tax=Paraburkholderia antibiotica TaxID=2728839 RepID=A0A7Y0A101_9BURK|nr:hypothetical protein [Paraburkholderia antibiotica]NML34521.1 hypothetical protein [Paraburkholderia antibiotica]
MKNPVSVPKPKVVQKVVKNTPARAPAPTASSSTGGTRGIAMPAKSCNCGGSGLK